MWAKKIQTGEIVTAYAQTELGHGSDVQSLATTAIYNPETGNFTLNNPTVESYKWWPGELGVYATHALVYAQIIIKEKKHGVFPLFVQIRDMETHKLLPDIEAGDIGPKGGMHNKDNGFLIFRNVEVPRDSLLGKYIIVTKEGKFETRGNLKVMYSGMTEVRKYILSHNAKAMAYATLIALRYSYIR